MTDEQQQGVIAAASKFGTTIVTALAPVQYLALILINLIFFGVMVWFLDARAQHSAEIIRALLAACLQR